MRSLWHRAVLYGVAASLGLGPTALAAQGPRAGYTAAAISSGELNAVMPASHPDEGKRRSVGQVVRNGAAIGAFGGLLMAPLVYSFCRTMEPGGTDCTGKAALGFGIMTATGAAIGYLVGASEPDPSVRGKETP